jgi:hypothetical protein
MVLSQPLRFAELAVKKGSTPVVSLPEGQQTTMREADFEE